MLSLIFTNTMADKVHHVQASDALLLQEIHCMRILFAKDGNQYIGASNFFFTIGGGLHMHDGALNHTLKSERRLSIHFIITRNNWSVVIDKVFQLSTQLCDIDCTCLKHFYCRCIV